MELIVLWLVVIVLRLSKFNYVIKLTCLAHILTLTTSKDNFGILDSTHIDSGSFKMADIEKTLGLIEQLD